MPNLLSSRRIFPLDCNESVTAEAFTLSTRWGRRSQFQDQPQDVDEESSRNADLVARSMTDADRAKRSKARQRPAVMGGSP
jgi:hypothetical protein